MNSLRRLFEAAEYFCLKLRFLSLLHDLHER